MENKVTKPTPEPYGGKPLPSREMEEMAEPESVDVAPQIEPMTYRERSLALQAKQNPDENFVVTHRPEPSSPSVGVQEPQKGEKFRIVQVNKNCFKMYLFGHFIGACSSEYLAQRREKDIADKINRYIHEEVRRRLPEALAALAPIQPQPNAEAKNYYETADGRRQCLVATHKTGCKCFEPSPPAEELARRIAEAAKEIEQAFKLVGVFGGSPRKKITRIITTALSADQGQRSGEGK